MNRSIDPSKHKPISVKTIVIIGVLFAFIVFLFVPILGASRTRPWFANDLDNLNKIVLSFHEYAFDNDGGLPAHASQVQDDFSVGEWEFVSRHDPNGQVNPVVKDSQPSDWYTYGSYRFYPTRGLNIDTVADPKTFVVAYCPPFKAGIDGKDHPTVFLDGRADMLSKDELFDLIVTQQQIIITELSNKSFRDAPG